MTAAARLQEQRDRALASANHIREGRARIKAQIRSGALPIEAVLLDPSPMVSTMTIGDLLLCTPRYGRVRVNKLLARSMVSPTRAVMALTERQRQLIVDDLGRLGSDS